MHALAVLERADGADERRHQVAQPAQAALIIEGALVLPAHLPDERAQLVAGTDRALDVEADQPFHVLARNAGRKRLHLHRYTPPSFAYKCNHMRTIGIRSSAVK